jgi:hypothetical protein
MVHETYGSHEALLVLAISVCASGGERNWRMIGETSNRLHDKSDFLTAHLAIVVMHGFAVLIACRFGRSRDE